MKKRSWLRGLLSGIVIYVLGVLIVGIGWRTPDFGSLLGAIFAVYFWPVIVVSLFIGWLYGKSKNKSI